MTKEEFKKEYIRMMDTLRNTCKGDTSCKGVDCNDCPFTHECFSALAFNAFETIELVEKWSKEHPVITMADRFNEVFGFVPMITGNHGCPHVYGFHNYNEHCDGDCVVCKKHFWDSEYKAPIEIHIKRR